MIFDDSIRAIATRQSYSRGEDLAAAGAVLDLTATELDSGLVHLDGRVRGSYDYSYDTFLEIDILKGTVVDYSCTCPAALKYETMCKHCVATALEFLDQAGSGPFSGDEGGVVFGRTGGSSPEDRSPSAFDGSAAGESLADESLAGGTLAGRALASGASDDNRSRMSVAGNAGSPATGGPVTGADSPKNSPQNIVERLQRETQDILASYRDGSAGTSWASAARSQDRARDPQPLTRPKTMPALPERRSSTEINRMIFLYSNGDADGGRSGSGYEDGVPGYVAQTVVFPKGETASLVPVFVAPINSYSTSQSIWSLRLRICVGTTSYVIKNISELIGCWKSQSFYQYGKKLAFCHTQDSFDQRSRELLDMLERIVETQRAVYTLGLPRYATYGYSSHTEGPGKELPLCMKDAADILELYTGGTVDYDSNELSSHKPYAVPVLRKDPLIHLEVRASRTGGYDLSIPAGLRALDTPERLYVLCRDTLYACSEEFRDGMGAFFANSSPYLHELHISSDDLSGFCGAVLPSLKRCVDISLPDELASFVPPAPQFAFALDVVSGRPCAMGFVTYGDRSLCLDEPPAAGQPMRDYPSELRALNTLRRYFPTPTSVWDRAEAQLSRSLALNACRLLGNPPYDTAYVQPVAPPATPSLYWQEADDYDLLYDLVETGLDELRRIGAVFATSAFRGIDLEEPPSIRIEASVRSNLLDLRVDIGDMDPVELLGYLRAYEKDQHYFKTSRGSLVALDGRGISSIFELAEGLGLRPDALLKGGLSVPLNKTLLVDALLKDAPGLTFDRDESFRTIVRDFDSISSQDYPVPPTLASVLRPYQAEGYRWMRVLAKLGFGGILADDMGLGKTVQVIAYLLAIRDETPPEDRLPALVVCPASLVYNWCQEIERFAPQLKAVAVVGKPAERRDAIEGSLPGDVLVTSYELLKRDMEHYAKAEFSCQVLDEAQYIKNRSTQSARCSKLVRTRQRFALTGTPIENRLAELWSIFDFLMPGLLGTYDSFKQRFELPVANGDAKASARLSANVGPFILRRLKKDVLDDLPEKNESTVLVHLEGEQDKLYRANAARLQMTVERQLPQEFATNKIAILAELTKLRQLCCHPSLVYSDYRGPSAKLETCLDLVGSAVGSGHKVLLFSQFTSMFPIISPRLEQAGIRYYELTGSTPKEERSRLVDAFQTDDVPVFLISLKAGGVGLNLTAADIVIHYDPWWNLAAQNQATDRAHRIGQTRDVSVMRVIAKDTIEEKIVALQEAKRDLADQIIGGEAVGRATLSREDILALLDS